jgi:hypothetical protein
MQQGPRRAPARAARWAVALLSLATWLPDAQAGPFTAGNLAVVSIDTTGAAGRTANVTLLEYNTAGTGQSPLNTVALPTTSGNALVLTNTTPSAEGQLSRAGNGQYLTLAGYNASGNSVPINASHRSLGRVDSSGAVDITTQTTSYPNAAINAAATNVGNRFWTGGAVAGTSGGLQTTPFGSTGATTAVAPSLDTRAVNVFGGQLYGSTATTIYRTDTALPAGSSTTSTLVSSGLADAAGFVLLDRDAGVAGMDTLYVADRALGLVKYSFDGTAWASQGAVAGGVFGIAGAVSGSTADLYVTTANGTTLSKFTDTAAFNSAVSGSYLTLATAASGTSFRGVAFTPAAVPEPGTLLLGGLAVAGFGAAAVRRRRRLAVARTP